MDKIRKNDEVIVLAGKDKGKRGVVQRRVDAEHVIVDGVNRQEGRQAEPDDRRHWWYRRQDHADSRLERRAVQRSDRQG